MDVFIIKSQTGEICMEKIQPTNNEFDTSIDPIISILNKFTSLRFYKVGRQEVCIEPPDGHGGGDVWEIISGSEINQLDTMKMQYSFDSEALSKIEKINNKNQRNGYFGGTSDTYSYILPVKNSPDSNWQFLEIPKFPLNDAEMYERYLIHHLKSLDIECKIVHNIQTYTISKIENTDLLREVDVKEIVQLLPQKTSIEEVYKDIPLSVIGPILEMRNNLQNSTAFSEEYNNNKTQINIDNDLLLVQCGNFYNAFGSDAIKLTETLNLKIFKNNEDILTVGFPVASYESKYKELLLNSGFKVDISQLATNENILAYYSKISPELVEQVRRDGSIDVPGVGGGQWNLKDEDPEYLAQLFAKATGVKIPQTSVYSEQLEPHSIRHTR